MTDHTIKIAEPYFDALLDGTKTWVTTGDPDRDCTCGWQMPFTETHQFSAHLADVLSSTLTDLGWSRVSPARHDADIAAAKAEAERALLDRLGEEGSRFYDVLDREMADSLRKDREYVDAFRASERAAGAAEVIARVEAVLALDKDDIDASVIARVLAREVRAVLIHPQSSDSGVAPVEVVPAASVSGSTSEDTTPPESDPFLDGDILGPSTGTVT